MYSFTYSYLRHYRVASRQKNKSAVVLSKEGAAANRWVERRVGTRVVLKVLENIYIPYSDFTDIDICCNLQDCSQYRLV